MSTSRGLKYPVVLEQDDNGTVMAYCPGLPGVVSYGNDDDEALLNVVDALSVMISGLIEDNEDIPLPGSPGKGQATVSLPPLVASKVLLYQRMRELGVSRAELARRLGGKNPTHVTRLLDVLHQSRHNQLDEAMTVLGARLTVTAEPLPELRRRSA